MAPAGAASSRACGSGWRRWSTGRIVVSLEETRAAMRLMAEKARVIAEGAGALPLAAALTGKAGEGPIVAIVSGGNLDLAQVLRTDRRLGPCGSSSGRKCASG